ncbi:glycosyl transferase family 1 [Psychroflexus planctonicus]|uniref:Glycosyl transferase family 1 n=1 Tax=Psychroflexus planctonicus TaxID=1526575 RepID=A0ABQ1SE70_9FLAO|nr:glycosyl transferase family 1 [Psychroflexus planctonicus]GGE33029.1 glycosyl transferase family 1 [Psychroflexus planctonicus]
MKKVLIIAYYWPPAGGPGVQRWLKFTKYLPDFGVKPILYVPKNPTYPITDESLNREVPKHIKVIKRSILEPHQITSVLSKNETKTMSAGIIAGQEKQSPMQKLMLYVRGNYFIPDARVLWVKPSIKYLEKYLTDNSIETIITTGPPHSLHLIGQGLKKQFTNLKWIADFRDPWVNIDYHSQLKFKESTQQKHIELEKSILQDADQIVVTSFETKREFSSKTAKPIEVITNGFDEVEAFDIDLSEAFSFVHVGSLLSERNPTELWKAFADLVEGDEHFKQFFELHFVGKVSQVVLNSIEENGLKDYVYLDGYLPHLEAVKVQHQAQVLLLIEANRTEKKGIIPGKIFEYLMAKRPILAIGPEQWDVQKIISETQAGNYFDYDSHNQLKKQIQIYFQDFLQGKLNVNSQHIAQYSRKSLTQKLSKLL